MVDIKGNEKVDENLEDEQKAEKNLKKKKKVKVEDMETEKDPKGGGSTASR